MKPWLFALLAVLCFAFGPIAGAEILHTEFGVANYNSYRYGNSERRFTVLAKTMSRLVEQFGPTGTIYLNDIDPVGLAEAFMFAKRWVSEHGVQIKLVALPGDYARIALPFVKTAHLTNPESDQLGDPFVDIEVSQDRVRVLENLAATSQSGLKITTYFNSGPQNCISVTRQLLSPKSIMTELAEKPLEYFFPRGARAMEMDQDYDYTSKVYRLVTGKNYVVPKTGLTDLLRGRAYMCMLFVKGI